MPSFEEQANGNSPMQLQELVLQFASAVAGKTVKRASIAMVIDTSDDPMKSQAEGMSFLACSGGNTTANKQVLENSTLSGGARELMEKLADKMANGDENKARMFRQLMRKLANEFKT